MKTDDELAERKRAQDPLKLQEARAPNEDAALCTNQKSSSTDFSVAAEEHEANVLLTAIIVSAQADFQWLNGKHRSIDAAIRTAERMRRHVDDLHNLLKVRSGQQQD